MEKTENYGLDLYELNDNGNLVDGYNASMRAIDSALEKQATDLDDALPITSENLATGAVTTDKISNGAVNSDKIATAAITSTKLATGAVTGDAIATGAVTSEAIADGAITSDMLAGDIIINGQDIAEQSISGNKLAPGTITQDKLASDSVGTSQIIDSSITNSKLGENAVEISNVSNNAFDMQPIQESNNLVRSGAVYAALQNVEGAEKYNNVIALSGNADNNFSKQSNTLRAYISIDKNKFLVVGTTSISLETSDWTTVANGYSEMILGTIPSDQINSDNFTQKRWINSVCLNSNTNPTINGNGSATAGRAYPGLIYINKNSNNGIDIIISTLTGAITDLAGETATVNGKHCVYTDIYLPTYSVKDSIYVGV